MAAAVSADLHGNRLFQVVALDDLLFFVMVDDVINTADEREPVKVNSPS